MTKWVRAFGIGVIMWFMLAAAALITAGIIWLIVSHPIQTAILIIPIAVCVIVARVWLVD